VTSALPPSTTASEITREFDEVYDVRRVRKVPRRLLLQVLHSSRALDTCLKEIVVLNGGSPPETLGGSIKHFADTAGPLGVPLKVTVPTWRQDNQRLIANERNKFMHEADVYPTTASDIAALLSNMHACLIDVLTRW
jgi:hypothetical protein